MRYDVIQIGANVGNTDNDPVYPRVLAGEIKTGFLIEANPKCIPLLRQTYKDYPSLEIHNFAISDHGGIVRLFVDNYEVDEGTSQHASLSLDFQHAHLHGKGYDTINEIEVPCMTLETFYVQRYISEVEWLFVDAEGHDYDILVSIDFDRVLAKNIYFENLHTDGPHSRGRNYAHLIARLQTFGYHVVSEDGPNTTLTK